MFTWNEFISLPHVNDISGFHCVTSWSRLDNKWKGVLFSSIANLCGILLTAKFIYIKAYDAYSTNLPLNEAIKSDVLKFISGTEPL